jgi:5-methylcytosine-specific restriction endonuclease McrA
MKSATFQFPEDRKFFVDRLANGDEQRFEKEFTVYFDFRSPAVKRREFGRIRNKRLAELIEEFGEVCQLGGHPDCSMEKNWEVDHFIPLSSNELNKKLRHMRPANGKKVPTQSFGSNNFKNLVLACRRCNAAKKHRIFWPKMP